MGQNKITKAQWRELISNYILYCNNRRDLGLLDFDADLSMKGMTDKEIIQSLNAPQN